MLDDAIVQTRPLSRRFAPSDQGSLYPKQRFHHIAVRIFKQIDNIKMVPPLDDELLSPQTRENCSACSRKAGRSSAPTQIVTFTPWGGVMLTGLSAVASASSSFKISFIEVCKQRHQIGHRRDGDDIINAVTHVSGQDQRVGHPCDLLPACGMPDQSQSALRTFRDFTDGTGDLPCDLSDPHIGT